MPQFPCDSFAPRTFPSWLGSWLEACRLLCAGQLRRREGGPLGGAWSHRPTCPPGCCPGLINEHSSPVPATSRFILISLPPLGNGHHVPPPPPLYCSLSLPSDSAFVIWVSGGQKSSLTRASPTGPRWSRGRMGGDLAGLLGVLSRASLDGLSGCNAVLISGRPLKTVSGPTEWTFTRGENAPG